MKKSFRIFAITLIGILALIIYSYVFGNGKSVEYVPEVDKIEVEKAFALLNNSLINKKVLYMDFLNNTTSEYGKVSFSSHQKDGMTEAGYDDPYVVLDYKETATYHVEAPESGLYYILLDYKPFHKSLSDYIIDIKINEKQAYSEMQNIVLPLYWSDETKDFPTDRYGDQISPKQIKKEDWTSLYLYNNTYYTAKPFLFELEEGENEITITNLANDGLGLGSITFVAPKEETPAYVDYRNQQEGTLVSDIIKINAIDYIEKNTTQAIYSAENNPNLTPFDRNHKMINTLSWYLPGTEVTYEINVPSDGYYHMAFHYMNSKEEFSVFHTLRIDGMVPFKELVNYPFPSTGNRWRNEIISDQLGNPYEIFLTKGTHTITLRSEQEPVVITHRYAKLISEHVTQLELEITKITGSTKDQNRTWKMTKYIPQIEEYLNAYATLIRSMQYALQDYTSNGVNSALLSDFKGALSIIDKVKEYPDEIALHTEKLTGKDNSILSTMSNFTNAIVEQSFYLDMIYVFGNKELPKPNPSFVESLGNGISALVNSFVSDKYKIEEDPEAVTIWVNRAMTHVDLMQKMADTEFTPKTGIKVKISVMPDVNKLTLAAAADETPDIGLGLLSHTPFDLASRDALYDLTQFDDFWTVSDRFVAGSLTPFIYNEGVYAIPETLDFHAIIYRTDIFQNLGLTPPDTWQEVVDMLPTLQRYGMNFYHNIASGDGYKWFYQTTPLIYQNNGRLFTEDGLKTAIDEPNAVKGIQALGDLFIKYSLETQVSSFFHSFRFSTIPIGIVDLQTYNLIKNGAPELEGQFALSVYPGTVQEDGSISRWYVAGGTNGAIFKDSEKMEESWEFLKWWTDYETQVNFAYTLQSTYGEGFVWLPANVDAIKDSPFTQEEKRVILEQVQWIRDVTRTPGQYMAERSLSDIWNEMVFHGVSAQVAVDEKTIQINREIRKKMMELGYYDEEGNMIKPYVLRDIEWIQEQIQKAKLRGE